jgi:glyoxylase-like metal-dependent hydrolase (beta-lactamase superfamily II)
MAEEPITRYSTSSGVRIYRIPLQVFPSLRGYAHLVVADEYTALIDVGSGQGPSDAQLQAGIAQIRTKWREPVRWETLSRIVITHAHIDHHGGLNTVRRLTNAPIAIHELDRRVLVHHEERLVLTRFRLGVFLRRAGVSETRQARMLGMYSTSKDIFRSVAVEDVLHDEDTLDNLFTVIHVPGHCPGQVCLQVDDILLTADHVLPNVALFIAPESLTAATGVDHFLQSLRRVAKLPKVRLCLGGHDQPVEDLPAAVATIEATQTQRIARIYEMCREPMSLSELTNTLYPGLGGYDELLALQKVGAYVEYLDQRGMLAIANLDEVAASEMAVPRYRAT